MLKYLFLCCTFPLIAAEHPFPEIIDFRPLQSKDTHQEPTLDLCRTAFNSGPEITPIFLILKCKYNIDTVIETGTFLGESTHCFSLLFDKVHTIEISPSVYEVANENLKDCPNVQCHLGSSEKILQDSLPSLHEKPILFYLDAHWGEYWPLLNELDEIAKTHKDNCIIVIDDCKVPGDSSTSYESYNNSDCSYEYFKDHLEKVFSQFSIHYLIPRAHFPRAKLIAIPTHWQKQQKALPKNGGVYQITADEIILTDEIVNYNVGLGNVSNEQLSILELIHLLL